MKFTIFHAKNLQGFNSTLAFNSENYEKVAEVELKQIPGMEENTVEEDLEIVFGLSQNMGSSWLLNKQITWHKDGDIRSTSVGDVITVDFPVNTTHAYLVDSMDFTEISNASITFALTENKHE